MANIRVNESDKEMLDDFCKEQKLTHAEAFHVAMDLLKKEQFARKVKAQFDALAQDPEALKAYHQESNLWDTVSIDGIELIQEELN